MVWIDFIINLAKFVFFTALGTAVPILCKYACDYFFAKREEAEANTDNRTQEVLMAEAEKAVIKGVAYVNQTFVDALKKAKTFNEHDQKEAYKRAYEAALDQMRTDTREYIGVAYGSLKDWLKVSIEAEVEKAKNQKAQ